MAQRKITRGCYAGTVYHTRTIIIKQKSYSIPCTIIDILTTSTEYKHDVATLSTALMAQGLATAALFDQSRLPVRGPADGIESTIAQACQETTLQLDEYRIRATLTS